MSLRPYRCQNPDCTTDAAGRLIHDFWAEAPVCPRCGLDGRTPLGRDVVVALELLHFAEPTAVRGKSTGRPACDGRGRIGVFPYVHVTAYAPAANCPKCRRTEAWQRAAEATTGVVLTKDDFTVGLDPATQTVTKG
jgi:hypothetical protein